MIGQKPKIMIVEDEISVLMELEEMLTENGYHVPGVADSGEQAIATARTLHPDLILMDIKLSGKMDGIDAAAIIHTEMDIPSVFLTGYGEKELVERAVKADPLGYIMKPLDQVQILAAVNLALGKMAQQKKQTSRDKLPNLPQAFISFTAQEMRVAEMIREGRETSEIADEMRISTGTIIWHRKKIRKKLGIDNTKIDLMVALRTLTIE